MSLDVETTNRGGAPLGNQNAAKGKRWRDAIMRALSRANGSIEAGLDKAAERLVSLATEGDKWALDHLAERLDGKAAQAIIGGDEDDPPLKIQEVKRVLVRAKSHD